MFIRPTIFVGSKLKKKIEIHLFTIEFIRPVAKPSSFGQIRVYSATFEFIRPNSSLFGCRINLNFQRVYSATHSSLFGHQNSRNPRSEGIRPLLENTSEKRNIYNVFATIVSSMPLTEFIRPEHSRVFGQNSSLFGQVG